jgi:hypothetical protein
MWSLNGALVLGFGHSDIGGVSGKNDVWMSADVGANWWRVNAAGDANSAPPRWVAVGTVFRNGIVICGGQSGGAINTCHGLALTSSKLSNDCPSTSVPGLDGTCGITSFGANCSLSTATPGSYVRGNAMVCGADGQWNGGGRLDALAPPPKWRTFHSFTLGQMSTSVVYCKRTRKLFAFGGWEPTGAAGTPQTTSVLPSDVDLPPSILWNQWNVNISLRWGVMMVCDDAGRVHIFTGQGEENHAILDETGALVEGPYTTGMTTRAHGQAVLIPSSGNMDILAGPGDGASTSIHRFSYRRRMWTVVNPSSPLNPIHNYKMAYSGQTLVVVGGIITASAFVDSVWTSPDDGVTWNSGGVLPAVRAGMGLTSINGILTFFGGGDSTSISNTVY